MKLGDIHLTLHLNKESMKKVAAIIKAADELTALIKDFDETYEFKVVEDCVEHRESKQ